MARASKAPLHDDPAVAAWVEEQLAKPGGHGPIPPQAQAVLAGVFGRPDPKRRTA